MTVKTCSKCHAEKPISEFGWRDAAHTRLNSRCKDCERAYQREWAREHPQNREEKQRHRRVHNLRQYGITIEGYEEMLARQGGVCAICKRPETHTHRGEIRALTVDHDHETGQVRGLLCAKCNMAVGLFEDDPEILEAAAVYVRSNRESFLQAISDLDNQEV